MSEPHDTVIAPGIVTNPARLRGRPTIEGTRITVERVLNMLAAGRTFDDVRASYPHLSREQLAAAVDYAQQLVIAQTPGVPGDTSAELQDWELESDWTTVELRNPTTPVSKSRV